MYHLVNNLQNNAGDALVGYYVKLKDDQGSYASLYADTNLTPIINVSGVADAAKTDENGQYDLYVDDGIYDVEFFDKNDSTLQVRRIPEVPMFSNTSVEAATDATLAELASTTPGKGASLVVLENGDDLETAVAGLEAADATIVADFNSSAADKGAALVRVSTNETAAQVFAQQVRITTYGAVFDVADDADIANATDDTAAWVAALAHLETIGGGTLLLPPGASKVTAQIDIPTSVPIRIVGTGCRGVYPGAYTAGTDVPSTVVPVHAGRSTFRFLAANDGDGSFEALDFNIATLETGTYPDSGFGWDTADDFLYGFSFNRVGVYGFKNASVGEAFVVYQSSGSELAIGQLLINDCCIHRNNWIIKTLNSTQINGFKFTNNKAGQNGYSAGNGGIAVGGHDISILDNILESNRDTIVVDGAFYDVAVRGNYFEANVGIACIRLNDIRGTYQVGPNNYGMALTFATAGQDPTTDAVLGQKVYLSYTGAGLCIDPYFPASTHKLNPPRLGRIAGNNLNTNLQYTYSRTDSLEGQSFAAHPSVLTSTQQGVTNVVRDINPATSRAMAVREYTTTGTGLVSASTSVVTGSEGEWVCFSWLLRRMTAAGEGVDPRVILRPNASGTNAVEFSLFNFRQYWQAGEWSLITGATRLTATMTSLEYYLYPYGISPTAGWVARFALPFLYTVSDVNKVIPFVNTRALESGTAAPTTGTWVVGDIVLNSAPAAAGTVGWICTTAGTPGTWKTWGTIAA